MLIGKFKNIFRYVTQKDAHSFNQNGFRVFKNYISKDQCQQALNRIDEIIKQLIPQTNKTIIFTGADDMTQLIDSADKVRLFYEPKAVKDGKFLLQKEQSVNKVAHNLYELEPIFTEITQNKKSIEILKALEYKNPVVVQSMAILKPPNIGGAVSIHQDSTYLISQPDTLLGLWIPLEKCTINNGCLWGIPEKRTPLYRIIENSQGKQLLKEPDWNEENWVPIEMEAGDLAIFHGRFVHKSLANLSNRSRYAYTWHIYDKAVSKWLHSNWIPERNFKSIY